MQETGLNLPPAFPSLHDTVPVGVVDKLEVSATTTVNVTCDPWFIVTGFGATVMVSEEAVLTVGRREAEDKFDVELVVVAADDCAVLDVLTWDVVDVGTDEELD